MTETELTPPPATPASNAATWDAQFEVLRRRFPGARDTILFSIHLMQMDSDVSIDDAKAHAAMHGLRITAASLNAAKRLLSPEPERAAAPHGDDAGSPTPQHRLAPPARTPAGRNGTPSSPNPLSEARSKTAQIRDLLAAGMSAGDIAQTVGCSRNLVYIVKGRIGRTAAKPMGRARPDRSPTATPPSGTGADALERILAAVKDTEHERDALRAALQQIRAVVREALA